MTSTDGQETNECAEEISGKSEYDSTSTAVGGSLHEKFNWGLMNQVFRCFWSPEDCIKGADNFKKANQDIAMIAMIGIAPRNEIEGMIAAQMVASHAATMECFRRAALTDQTYDGRQMNINLANKSARTFVALNEALMKRRGESGKQQMNVHHHHHDHRTDARMQVAAESAVFNLRDNEGSEDKKETQPHEQRAQPAIDQSPAEPIDVSPLVRSKKQTGQAVPVSSDEREE